MPYVTREGRALPLSKAFSLNNKSFPSNWLTTVTEDDRQAEGISWVTPEEPPVVRAPLERLVEQGAARAKGTAWNILSPSDWRKLPGNEMPDDWEAWRESVKAECQRLEGEYALAESYEDFDLIKQEWPLDPNSQAERDRMEQEEKEQEDGGV